MLRYCPPGDLHSACCQLRLVKKQTDRKCSRKTRVLNSRKSTINVLLHQLVSWPGARPRGVDLVRRGADLVRRLIVVARIFQIAFQSIGSGLHNTTVVTATQSIDSIQVDVVVDSTLDIPPSSRPVFSVGSSDVEISAGTQPNFKTFTDVSVRQLFFRASEVCCSATENSLEIGQIASKNYSM
jgi:hypothetical protein